MQPRCDVSAFSIQKNTTHKHTYSTYDLENGYQQ